MMSERNFMKLLKTGRWEKASAERCILKEGAKVSDLIVLCKGSVEIRVGEGSGKEVARLDAGRFVGEMSYVTTEPASASVWTSEPTEYVAWAREALDRLFAANPEVRNGIQLAIGADLAKKVRHR